MARFLRVLYLTVLAGAWSHSAYAQETDLMLFGDFETGATIEVGGIVSYVVNCNEIAGVCEDNIGNSTRLWKFKDDAAESRRFIRTEISWAESEVRLIARDCMSARNIL